MDKKSLRKLYKNIRKSVSLSEKQIFDKRILTYLVNSDIYKSSDLILTYISFNDEADTLGFIKYALKNNKRIAVPVCENKDMHFCEIRSLNDLVEGKFGIPTVDSANNIPVKLTDNALCIVPAVCFDKSGNRIGYGGGYYDRFLSKNDIKSIGICYERCLCECINKDIFDISVDYILTEKQFRNSKNKEVSVYE